MEQKLKELISKVLNINLLNFKNEDICPNNISDWDSLAHLNIIMSIEEKFNIQVNPDEIVAMTEGYISILNILRLYGVE